MRRNTQPNPRLDVFLCHCAIFGAEKWGRTPWSAPQDLAFRELYIRIMLRYVTLPIGDVFRTDVAPCFERCIQFFTLPMVEAAEAMIEGMLVFRAR